MVGSTSSGRVKCTLANWTGIAYKIPRTELGKCKDIELLKQSGVYFLFGANEDTDESVVYIGKVSERANGEGLLYRLQEHNRNPEKNYWTEAVIFTTSNKWIGSTEISWLENRFYNMVEKAKRSDIQNGNVPSAGNVTEETHSDLVEFIENARFVMGALGYNVFEPLLAEKKETAGNAETSENMNMQLCLEQKSKTSGLTSKATCQRTAEGFVVLKGACIEKADAEKIPMHISNMRKEATLLKEIDDKGILQKDKLFKSASATATFVTGSSISGNVAWKNGGKTLGEILANENSGA